MAKQNYHVTRRRNGEWAVMGAIHLPDRRLDGQAGTILLQLEAPEPHSAA